MATVIQDGDVLTVSAPKKLVSGELFLLGSLALVASSDAKRNEIVAAFARGVFELPLAEDVAPSIGEIAYFAGAGVTNVASEGAIKIGHFLTEAGVGRYAEIRLSS